MFDDFHYERTDELAVEAEYDDLLETTDVPILTTEEEVRD